MPTRRQTLIGLAAVGGLSGLNGCSAAAGGGGKGSAALAYRNGVQVLERSAADDLILGTSLEGTGFLLNGQNAVARGLKAGDVLFVKELLARRIVAAAPYEDGNIVVLTDPAELTDVVENAKISASQPIRFGGGDMAEVEPPAWMEGAAHWLVPSAEAQTIEQSRLNKAEAEGNKQARGAVLSGIKSAIVEDWTVTCTPTMSKGRIEIHLEMTRDIAGLRCVITGDGHLQDFDYECDIDIEKSTYQKLQSGFKNMNGVMNFKWEAATGTPGAHTGDYRFRLPAAIQIPLYKMLEGFPLFLEISSAFVIKPAFSGGQEVSRGAFRITYDGYQNFSVKTGNIDANGHVSGDIEFLEGQNISTLAPLGMVIGFAVPRIELTFGFNKILSFSDEMKEATAKVDAAVDWLARKMLTDDQYAHLKSSPYGSLKLGTALDNATKSDAAAYIEMVTTVGMSNTGMSVVTPCTRHDIHLWAKVGASAEAFGQKVAETTKDVYSKDFSRIDPPGTALCESVGT